MYLFAEREQPYGLLSNFALTPFNASRKSWQSVNQYIYVSTVRTPMKQRMMREVLKTSDPFSILLDMENEFWDKKFFEGLTSALDAAINERSDLQKMIKRSGFINYKSERELENFLNQKRYELIAEEEEIPPKRAARIISGVTDALKAGVDIDPYSTLADLKEYESVKQPYDIKEDSEIFSHLHELVPYIRLKLDNAPELERYRVKLEKFKRKLFNRYFDDKLKTEHPNIAVEDYAKTREQLFESVSRAEGEALVNDIFGLYESGKLKAEISRAAGEPPEEPVFRFDFESSPIVDIKGDSHPLSPYGMGPVFIDGRKHRSPLHYAYGEMFKLIGLRINSDTIPKRDLTETFRRYHTEYLARNLREYADIGINAKLNRYSVLVHLLKTTGDRKIFWNDLSDPVLGIGSDGKGENAVGQILMNYRDRADPRDAPVSSYPFPMDNIFVKHWALMRLRDIYNSMNTMINPTTDGLEELYKFPRASGDIGFKGLHPEDRRIILAEFPELTDDMLKIAWPLMYPQMYVIKKLTDSELVAVMVKAQGLYLGKIPTSDEERVVKVYLKNYFTRREDNIKLRSFEVFSDKILSGLHQRVIYWLNLILRTKPEKTREKIMTEKEVQPREDPYTEGFEDDNIVSYSKDMRPSKGAGEKISEKEVQPREDPYTEGFENYKDVSFNDNIVFQFYSKSKDMKPGKGAGEKISEKDEPEFLELAAMKNWRRVLSNFYEGEFVLDGLRWLSVEHFYHASKFKKSHPGFYKKFSLDSGSDISKLPEMAKGAGGKTGKFGGKQIRPASITADADFFSNGENEKAMYRGQMAKYTQVEEARDVLFATRDAKLTHFLRGHEPIVFYDTMKIREVLKSRNF